jgi:hypothetical protein
MYGMEGALLGLPHQACQLPGSPDGDCRPARARHPRQDPVSRRRPRFPEVALEIVPVSGGVSLPRQACQLPGSPGGDCRPARARHPR